MAWTPSASWAAGEVPPALKFNTYVRDNFEHLKAPPIVVYSQRTPVSTSSTSYTQFASFDFSMYAGRILFSMHGQGYHPTGGSGNITGKINLKVDGVSIVDSTFGLIRIPFNTVGSVPFAGVYVTPAYSTGVRVVTLELASSSAGQTFQITDYDLVLREI